MAKAEKEYGDFRLRKIPPELFRLFKVICVAQNKTYNTAMNEALSNYVEKHRHEAEEQTEILFQRAPAQNPNKGEGQ